ncbi:MAG TPA: nicotinate-nucleotide--dimethylbenzimidazole phosphoribosyltransferase [Burkholderiales bacterium]|nr:nicotinate-nucleotide--dimethylbenzimidazole phosphoribosyltransferase [Burkholderiales bacterium]
MLSADWLRAPAAPLDQAAERAALARQDQLTKPRGALGRLEEMAIALAAMQGRERPSVDRVRIVVFAADHGVAAEGVSAYPQAVTVEMVRNFSRGGAAISVLARALQAELEVADVGTARDPGPLRNVISHRAGPGTANLSREAAMTQSQCGIALQAGYEAVQRATRAGAQLFIGGEMGIANTTSATALACALLGQTPEDMVGPGTGLDAAGIARKTAVIRRALQLHGAGIGDPMELLRRLGGFEIVALAGAYLACAQSGLAALVDGFVASTAALATARLCPGASAWLMFAHESAEPGHQRILEALQSQPVLRLRMRLGEGSGAAVAVPLLRLACALHGEMTTFAEAGVSDREAR